MVVIHSERIAPDGDGTIIEAQVDSVDELKTDETLIGCAPTSEAWASDLSFFANKMNNDAWNIVYPT